MKKFFTYLAGIALVVLLFGCGLALLGLLMWGLYKVIDSGELTVIGTVTAAIITLLGGVISISLLRWKEKKLQLDSVQQKKKAEVYGELLKIFLSDTMNKTPKGREKFLSSQDFKEKISKINEMLILWASPNVIKSFAKWRSSIFDKTKNNKKVAYQLVLYENYLKAIRLDLGLSNSNLKPTNILSLFINDIPYIE